VECLAEFFIKLVRQMGMMTWVKLNRKHHPNVHGWPTRVHGLNSPIYPFFVCLNGMNIVSRRMKNVAFQRYCVSLVQQNIWTMGVEKGHSRSPRPILNHRRGAPVR
jgi:hypothetical protein